MEKKQLHPATKDVALKALGVASKKNRAVIAGQIEFVLTKVGRQIVSSGHYQPSLLIGVSGAVRLRHADGREVRIEAPFVLGSWLADHRQIAMIDAHAATEVALLIADARAIDVLATGLAGLRRLSEQTAQLATPPERVIDMTAPTPEQRSAERERREFGVHH